MSGDTKLSELAEAGSIIEEQPPWSSVAGELPKAKAAKG